MSVLKVSNISCEIESELFSNISFDLHTSELIHIQGPNGGGKTTLLRCLLGLFPLSAGEVSWFDTPLTAAEFVIAEKVLYQGHELGIKMDLSPKENLLLWVRTTSNRWQLKTASELEQKIIEALSFIGLISKLDCPCRQLSSGQKRRVALSKLLLTDAQVLILDEPFSAIDIDGVELLKRIIGDFVLAGGSVLLTNHQALTLPVTVKKVCL